MLSIDLATRTKMQFIQKSVHPRQFNEPILSPPYPTKQKYNVKIPTNIFQTWHTKILPPLMMAAVNSVRRANPRFNYYLFDDNDCREFIQKNYHAEVLNAYDSLLPGAYKADLWRYCVLHTYGGIYLDIKYIPMNQFKFITLTEKEHFCLDIDNNGIYNAIMVCQKGNPILKQAINQIVEHVRIKYYGNGSLDPTGPGLLSRYFSKQDKNSFDMKHKVHSSLENRYILFNNYYVLKSYPYYMKEHNLFKKVDYYGVMWTNRNIYKN